MRKALAVVTIAFLAVLAPAEFTPEGEQGIVQFNGACAQATSCKKLDEYICSTYHDDYIGYVCTSGCEEAVE